MTAALSRASRRTRCATSARGSSRRRAGRSGDRGARRTRRRGNATQPAAALLLDDVLGGRPEVLAIEARRVRRRREVARAEQQHVAEALLARPAGQRQPRPRAGDLALRRRGTRPRDSAAGPGPDRRTTSRCRTGGSGSRGSTVTCVAVEHRAAPRSADARRAFTCTSKLSCSTAPPIATSFCSTLSSRLIEERVDAARASRARRASARSRRASAARGRASASGRCTSRRRRRSTSRRRRSARRSRSDRGRTRGTLCRRSRSTHDQVGALAGLERAGRGRPGAAPRAPSRVAIASASRAGTAVGSPPVPLASSAASRISSNMSRSLFDAAPSVPMPTLTPSSSIFATGATPAAELQVARRVVRDAGAGVLQRPHLAFVHVHAVRGQHLRVEQPLLLDPRHHRHAVRSPRLLDLEQRLGEVRVQRHVELDGELGAGAQDLRRAGVRRVRRRRRHDQRMALPPLDEVARARQRVLVARGVGRGKPQHRLPAQRAQAGGGRRLGDRVLEVVHVGEAGDARPDHLGAAEAACRARRSRGSRTRARPASCSPSARRRAAGRRPGRAAASSARACAR